MVSVRSDRNRKAGGVAFYIRECTLSMQEGVRRVLQIFQKKFVAQETKDLNISWPGNFFRKYFMALPINFSFLSKANLLSNIPISNHQRS